MAKRVFNQRFFKFVNSIDTGVFFLSSKCKYLANDVPGMSRSILRREPNLTEVGRRHGDHAMADKKSSDFLKKKLSSPGCKANLGGPAGSSAP